MSSVPVTVKAFALVSIISVILEHGSFMGFPELAKSQNSTI